MPFFFIAPLWLLAIAAGLSLLFFRRLRFLSSYLVLASTGGLVLSLLASTLVLWLGTSIFNNRNGWAAIVVIGGYLASIPVFGLVGVLLGILAARRINRRLRWTWIGTSG